MSTRHQVRPTAPQLAGCPCVNPAHHAQQAHQTAQRAAGILPPVTTQAWNAPSVHGRRFKISKNWVIGILIFLLVGTAGALNDKDNEINNLKAKVNHSAPAKVSSSTSATDAIKLCEAISAKGDLADCVIKVLGH